MNREQLAHVVRAAARIIGDESDDNDNDNANDNDNDNIIVIGSQAILGSFPEIQLPTEVMMSMEADIAFEVDPGDVKADLVEGAIGEGSQFHETFAYYAQGVSVSTAVLPAGWETRVVPYDRADVAPGRAVCLDASDLVVSKLVAAREKDVEFATALIRQGLVDVDVLRDRAQLLPRPGGVIARVQSTIERCHRRAQRS